MRNVILSTALILEEGTFKVTKLTVDQALAWVNNHDPINFCGHETTLALGLEPAKDRAVCPGYEKALCLKPLGRLEFGREYTVEEIDAIGVEFTLIEKM